jgi:hypothetical protein
MFRDGYTVFLVCLGEVEKLLMTTFRVFGQVLVEIVISFSSANVHPVVMKLEKSRVQYSFTIILYWKVNYAGLLTS